MSVALYQPYRLNPQVALRPEPFGALAYNYDNRRLVFLRSPDIVEVVALLDSATNVQAALDTAGIAQERQGAFVNALTELEHAGVIDAR